VSRRLVSTPAGWAAAAACTALAASVSLAAAIRPLLAWALLPAAASALAVVIARTRGGRWGLAALLLAAAGAGMLRGALLPAGDPLAHLQRSGTTVLTGTVREGTGSRRAAAQVVVDVDGVESAEGRLDTRGGVLATLRTSSSVLPGDRVEVDATGLRAVRGSGAELALSRDGIDAVAQSATLTLLSEGGPSLPRLLAQGRGALASAIDAALPEPAASLVTTLTFAIPRPLPPTLSAALRDSGLAHLLATSGLKVVLVAGMAGALLAALATPPRARLLLSAAAVGGYILLCGASPAALRSAAMAATGWALYGTGRSADPLPLLTAVAAAMLMVAPDLARDVGFQLSFLGTLGILLFAAPIAARLPGPRLLREPFAVTLAASVVTLPVMASTFGVVSFAGPLANALAVPLLAPLLVCGGLGAALSLLWPAAGLLPLQLAGALASMIGAIATWSAGLPFAALHVAGWPPLATATELVAVAAAVLTWRVARRRRAAGHHLLDTAVAAATDRPLARPHLPAARRPHRLSRPAAVALSAAAALLAGSLLLVVANRPDGRLHLSVLDVGAARAVLVRTAAGDHALVDTGADPQSLLDALGPALSPLTRSLGLLVLTGGDRAGTGGLSGLAARYQVDRAVAPDGLPAAARTALSTLADRGTAVTITAAATAWTWGGATWQLLPLPGAAHAVAALLVEDPTGSALLAGALDTAAQDELAGIEAQTLRADLLVAPPGGALVPALVAAVHPQSIAVPTARGARTTTTTLVAGPGVRRTGDAGTLTYAGGDGGLTST
jgi:ComEC/Rec2-related protein